MASWLDLLMGGQAPQFPPGQQPPAPPFNPQQMAVAPTFAQAPQMAQDVAAGIADPLLKAGNYLGGDQLIDIMRKYGLIGALGGSMSAPYFAPQGQQQ